MYKRIIIKVGTKVLSREDGHLDTAILEHLVGEMCALKKQGIEAVLVTSGAVGAGRSVCGKNPGKETVADKQMFAAVGQIKLMETYTRLFEKRGYRSAQVLVTKEDFRDKNHYHNMRECFRNLLREEIIPIVNENDVVAIKELVFTDNDELAGLVAAELKADAVIILSSVDGVLSGDPRNTAAKPIPEITLKNITAMQKYVTREKTPVGRGGMVKKFAVAKKLMSSGMWVHIANGKKKNVLGAIMSGAREGTVFVPSRKTSGIKRRLAHAEGLTAGAIVINKRAEELLLARGRVMSILPVGVLRTEGSFKKGDVIEIRGTQNRVIGFGVSACDSEDIQARIGTKGGKAVVHYDYLFLE